ncbi:hypothetical protein DV737_g1330, partial [Chaetothyriales sp. CBS 132003]
MAASTPPRSNFPALTPFATFQFRLSPPFLVGSLSRGTPLTVVPIHSGTVRTEEAWHKPVSEGGMGGVRISAEVVGGGGLPVVGELGRGTSASVDYIRIVDITPELHIILGGNPASQSTRFGNSFINVSFESGSEKYQDLERAIFVGSGRFVVGNSSLMSEYKVSRVGAGSPAEDAQGDNG